MKEREITIPSEFLPPKKNMGSNWNNLKLSYGCQWRQPVILVEFLSVFLQQERSTQAGSIASAFKSHIVRRYMKGTMLFKYKKYFWEAHY